METKKRQDTFHRESLLFSRKGEKNIAPCPRTACRQTCRLRPTAVWEVRTPPAARANASTLQQNRSTHKTAIWKQKRGKMLSTENRSFFRKGEKRSHHVHEPHAVKPVDHSLLRFGKCRLGQQREQTPRLSNKIVPHTRQRCGNKKEARYFPQRIAPFLSKRRKKYRTVSTNRMPSNL